MRLFNLWHGLYLVYAFFLFFLLMCIVLPLVVLGSLFGSIRGGNFIYRVCTIWSDVWFFLVGVRCRVHFEVPHDPSQHYIFVANHSSYLDAAILVHVVRQPVRVLGKAEIASIPLFGYIYRKAIVTVDRSSPEDRARSVAVLKSVLLKGVSVFIFPEGTFNMTTEPLKNFYDGAFRIAIETQTPLKPILLLDIPKRMRTDHFFSLRPGSCRAVYLQEIGVSGYNASQVDQLKAFTFQFMEKKLQEYKAL